MTGPRNFFDLECEALHELMRLIESRVAAERACKEAYEAMRSVAQRENKRVRKSLQLEKEREQTAIQTAWNEARETIKERYTTEQAAADRLFAFTTQEARDRAATDRQKTQAAYADALWTADSLFEAAEKQAHDQKVTLQRKAAAGEEAISRAWDQAEPLLLRGRVDRETLEAADRDPGSPRYQSRAQSPMDWLDIAIAHAEERILDLRNLRILRYTGISGVLIWFVLFTVLGASLFFFVTPWIYAAAGGMAFTLLATTVTHMVVCSRARRQTLAIGQELAADLFEAEQARLGLLRFADEEHSRMLTEATTQRERSRQKAHEKFPVLLRKIEDRENQELVMAADKHESDSQRLRNWCHDALQKAERHFAPGLQESQRRFDLALHDAESTFEQQMQQARQQREMAWNQLTAEWRDGQERIGKTLTRLKAEGLEHCPDWDSPVWDAPPVIDHIARGIRFGDICLDLNQIPHGVPEDEDLQPSLPTKLRLPAFLPFPNRCALLLRTRDQGRTLAVQALQSMMLRFLTAVPAGKVRFTIIDPVGLGENFAAFMHLADYDEQLISARIWTETSHIEKRLSDLTAHMENVIQKYLRNQYQSIEEYNAHAGEVAEPFRVLVIANFPTNFSLEAARRLVSIVNSGSTCGVFTLMSVDTRQPLPQGFQLADLEQACLTLSYKNDAFIWKDPALAPFLVTLERPPVTEHFIRLIRQVGERSRDASRVEVPFRFVSPGPEAIWSRDSRRGISVPIGRAGATKQQLFQVGQGTAQHALIAGKTGSGKSTLLHVLITNLALHYSPQEVELYLIDFKKGVEFKPYAACHLPHARVVAIESEREFGLSVLQRLDAELRERGDRFRELGVNDIAGYRDEMERNPRFDLPMKLPRILLVVDEFQEFFVEDDRLSQEAALLLDRLVRQGRAFGLHVLLGSQTLGGAYSLARSTIDQMAIRIALQCSDLDAQLILSKDNTAARLLSRPGEAIYNDANGLLEGNDLFQVVWLSDAEREEILHEVAREAHRHGIGTEQRPIVFEGNVDADITRNVPLRSLLEMPTRPAGIRAPVAWLGDPVAIKDPTSVTFRSSGGHNLLMVGQHDVAALNMTCMSMLSLAAQVPPTSRFLVLDGTPEDDPNAGMLGRMMGLLPQDLRFPDRTELGSSLAELAAEVTARIKGERSERTPAFLIVLGLHRYRELRKDDDMSFGRRSADRAMSPNESLTTILRDGPMVGIHSIVWCDALTNLNRSIDRPMLREFGLRVLFQMNANDSSALIDAPSASRLGRHRALLITDEMTQPEKFRPYGFPDNDWLRWAKERLQR